jgi:hypothetical protein
VECHLFRLLIERYHDGELAPAERAEYENHRRQCEECRESDARFGMLIAALDQAPLFEPSADFDRGVLSRINPAAYRVSPARRAARAIERGWNAAPVLARNTIAIAALCAVIITVYQPLLDYMIVTIRHGAEALWSGMLFSRELAERVIMIWKGAGAVRNYEIVGQTLLRALHRFASGLNPVQGGLAIASVLLAAVVLYRLLGAARRKGETNVGIL